MKNIIIIIIFICLVGCERDEPISFSEVAEVVLDTTNNKLSDFIADGTSKLDFAIKFNQDAKLEDINAKVNIVNASFDESEGSELILSPKSRQNGVISAEFTIVAPTKVDTIVVDVDINSFVFRRKFSPKISEPASLKLSKSANSVLTNYKGEVTIEGFLANAKGTKVSNGFKVVLSDFLNDGTPLNGSYRNEKLSSGSDSKISAIYTPPNVEPNQFFTIQADVLNAENQALGINSTIKIYLIQE